LQGLLRQQAQQPAVGRFEAAEPNDLWQMDFKAPLALTQGCCYPLAVLDDHRRYLLGL
jgi:hypothetical protein